jgi:phosphate transport system substrate-binding protein
MGALEQSAADVAVLGRELELNEYLGFYETCGFNPTEITVASGTLDVPGASWAPVIFVNRTNPIGQLTLGQLDGIFGAQRSGAYRGFRWSPELARSAAQNLRTWGQVGLTGQWADQPIHTYGYATGGMAHFFEAKVFSGGTKWNENYHEYIENGTKIMAAGAESGGILSMLATLEHDPLGIGWAGFPQWKQVPQVSGIKVVALALKAGGPFVYPTKTTLADRSYPLTRSIYLVLAKEPGGTLSPKVKDFVRYVLSAEGQAAVREQGVYFALPAALAAQEAGKLE